MRRIHRLLFLRPPQLAARDPLWTSVVLLVLGQTTVVDSSVAGNVLNVTTPVVSTTYPIGGLKSIAFNGTNDFIQTSNIAGARVQSASCIECWIKPTSLQDALLIGQRDLGTGFGWELFTALNGSFYVQGSSGAPTFISSAASTIVANAEQHLAYDYDGTTHRIWHQGALKASSTTMVVTNETAVALRVGYRATSIYPFGGGMSCLRITTASRYTSAFTPPSVPFATA